MKKLLTLATLAVFFTAGLTTNAVVTGTKNEMERSSTLAVLHDPGGTSVPLTHEDGACIVEKNYEMAAINAPAFSGTDKGPATMVNKTPSVAGINLEVTILGADEAPPAAENIVVLGGGMKIITSAGSTLEAPTYKMTTAGIKTTELPGHDHYFAKGGAGFPIDLVLAGSTSSFSRTVAATSLNTEGIIVLTTTKSGTFAVVTTDISPTGNQNYYTMNTGGEARHGSVLLTDTTENGACISTLTSADLSPA